MSVVNFELDVELTGKLENRKATLDKLRQEFEDYLGCTQRWFYFSPDGDVVRGAECVAIKIFEPNWNNSAPWATKSDTANRRSVVDLQPGPQVPVETNSNSV